MVHWYEFHNPSSLMSPSPGLTFKVFVVSYVVSTKATITTQVPLAVWQFLPKALSLSHFPKNPAGPAPVHLQKFSNSHRFQTHCASHQSGTQIQKHSQFFASYPNLINPWKNCHHSLIHAHQSPHQVCLSCPVNISITSRAAGGLIVTSVMLSNNWAIHTSVAPTI